jgi:hypothetical protein
MKKKLENMRKKVLAKLPDEKSFRFYNNLNNPTGKMARSLEEFIENIKNINLSSLEFHTARGDFSNWISDSLKDNALAKNLEKLKGIKGEQLRKKMVQTVNDRYKALTKPIKVTKKKVKKKVKKVKKKTVKKAKKKKTKKRSKKKTSKKKK